LLKERERELLLAGADKAIALAEQELRSAESDPHTTAQRKKYWRDHIQELKVARQECLTASIIKKR
jgi:hypothetical protein